MLYPERVSYNETVHLVFIFIEVLMNFITYKGIKTFLHFSIRIRKFKDPEECTVRKTGNRLLIRITKWKFEVIGSYEA